MRIRDREGFGFAQEAIKKKKVSTKLGRSGYDIKRGYSLGLGWRLLCGVGGAPTSYNGRHLVARSPRKSTELESKKGSEITLDGAGKVSNRGWGAGRSYELPVASGGAFRRWRLLGVLWL